MLSRHCQSAATLPASFYDLDRLFSEVFPVYEKKVTPSYAPAMNLYEDEKAFHAELELPGFKLSEIDVTLERNELKVRGERKDVLESINPGPETPPANAEAAPNASTPKKQWHRKEWRFGTFERTVRFPVEIQAEHVQAELREGVLRLTLPKVAQIQPKKISIHGT